MQRQGPENPVTITLFDPVHPGPLQKLQGRRIPYHIVERYSTASHELAEALARTHVSVSRSATKITAEILNQLPSDYQTELLIRAGVGMDTIDVEAARRRNIEATNTPESNTQAAAELTFHLLGAVARNIPELHGDLQQREWKKVDDGIQLHEKTIGLVGLGRVGSKVARIAKGGYDMRVLAYDPFIGTERARQLGVELVSLEDLLKQSDFVSLHLPLNEQTQSIMNKGRLELMKSTAILINTARGELVEQEALIEILQTGRLAGAGLDVYPDEPNVDPRLFGLKRVVTTPHIGAGTIEAQIGVSEEVVEKIIIRYEGEAALQEDRIREIDEGRLKELAPYMEVAARIASLALFLAGEKRVEAVVARLAGDFSDEDISYMESQIIRGLVRPVSDVTVSNRNYHAVARQRGYGIATHIRETEKPYTDRVQVRLMHEQGETEITGIYSEGEPEIVSLNGIKIKIPLIDDYLVIVRNYDRPGRIARVGRILARDDINISHMAVKRISPRREAIMALTTDKPLNDDLVAKIKGKKGSGISSVEYYPVP